MKLLRSTRSSPLFPGVFQEAFLVVCPVASLMESSGELPRHWILFHSRPHLRRSRPPQRVRVGGSVQRAKLIRQVRPRYPVLAVQARIQGTVILEATISELGSVEDLRVIEGHPLLIGRALHALRQWRYRPHRAQRSAGSSGYSHYREVQHALRAGSLRGSSDSRLLKLHEFHRARLPNRLGFHSAAI